jgi:hypothetical protein
MRKITSEILVAIAAASFATAGIAGGKLGAGGGGGVGVGAGANVGAAGAHVGANAGVNANASASGEANSNGRFADEREFGRDRAQTRMSEEGLEHQKQKSNMAPSHRKGPKNGVEASGSAKESAETRLNSN